ncbi:hypothetical protein, partial [Propionibacterium sp.]|uniref:hypothetical protein n=1 Tax=Propionibacterium sp. TaxID=1977903 RepID=UPI0039ED0729
MTTRPLSRFNARFAVWFAVAFVVWTPLALHTGLFAGIDATSNVPRLAPESAAAQIVSAVVLVTHPIVICAALVILGLWALRRRLRHLGYAVVLAGLLSWLAAELLKVLIRRPLPPSPLSYAISYHGYAYPSSHMAVATAAVGGGGGGGPPPPPPPPPGGGGAGGGGGGGGRGGGGGGGGG